jgi:hypothetical protein
MFASKTPFSSETFVLPRMIAPTALSLATTVESPDALWSCRAIEPPVVAMPSTSNPSLSRTGRPNSGPRCLLSFLSLSRFRSSARASLTASGLIERTAWVAGPSAFVSAIR